ncbi:MAG: hypothetical protein QY307_06710 [Acidimicrobiia bacterium]|nr:MAG: hypothetical protein QY307_06710 [Acidimicrobiia bacterium]
MKRTVKIVVSLAVVASMTLSGIAWAATSDEEAPAGEARGYSVILANLASLVEDGTITQEQAEAVASTLAAEARERRVGLKMIAEIGEFLGLDREEWKEALEEYDTIAEIAVANGSSGEEVVEHLLGLIGERLDEAVADGKLTQEEADEKLANAEERLTEMVNNPLPEPGEGHYRRWKRGGMGGDA